MTVVSASTKTRLTSSPLRMGGAQNTAERKDVDRWRGLTVIAELVRDGGHQGGPAAVLELPRFELEF
jgi:hypothetical protein